MCFTIVRHDEVRLLLKGLLQESNERWTKIEMRSKFRELSFNIVIRMIAGKRYYGKDAVGEEAAEFRRIIKEVVELHGTANLGDYLPIFQWVDFQGVEKRMIRLMGKMDRLSQNLIDEIRGMRKELARKERKMMTLIDVMLSLQEKEPEYYTDQTLKGVIMVLLLAFVLTLSRNLLVFIEVIFISSVNYVTSPIARLFLDKACCILNKTSDYVYFHFQYKL